MPSICSGLFLNEPEIAAGGRDLPDSSVPGFSWEWELKLEYLTYYLSMLVLLLLLKALFPAEVSPTIQRVTAVLSLSYSALVLLTPPAHIYTHTLTSYQLYTMFLVFYFIYVLAVASRRQREGARFMLVGGIIYCASIIYDVFFANFRTLVIGHLAPLGGCLCSCWPNT